MAWSMVTGQKGSGGGSYDDPFGGGARALPECAASGADGSVSLGGGGGELGALVGQVGLGGG